VGIPGKTQTERALAPEAAGAPTRKAKDILSAQRIQVPSARQGVGGGRSLETWLISSSGGLAALDRRANGHELPGFPRVGPLKASRPAPLQCDEPFSVASVMGLRSDRSVLADEPAEHVMPARAPCWFLGGASCQQPARRGRGRDGGTRRAGPGTKGSACAFALGSGPGPSDLGPGPRSSLSGPASGAPWLEDGRLGGSTPSSGYGSSRPVRARCCESRVFHYALPRTPYVSGGIRAYRRFSTTAIATPPTAGPGNDT
jgi:hypothetical protein